MSPLLESREAGVHAELAQLLESAEFSHSRMMRDFLSYVCERRLQGATHIDQMEIAENVLNKGDSFNPYEDASVRKLASLTRQRLQSYYERTGEDRPVRILLPPRTYAPEFVVAASSHEQERVPESVQLPRQRRWWPLATAVVVVAIALVGWFSLRNTQQELAAPSITIKTQWGEVWSKELDLSGSSILLGPELQPHDDAVVRLRFSPEQQYQQAGLMIWEDADHYVRFGRRFHTRTYLEFGAEEKANFRLQPANWHYDAFGQDGSPIWLRISRNDTEYRAFTSRDGVQWEPFGTPISFQSRVAAPRFAVYGFNGRRQAAEATAEFAGAGVGLLDVPEFWHGTEVERTMPGTGWLNRVRCPEVLNQAAGDAATESSRPGLLNVPASGAREVIAPCSYSLVQSPRQESWEIATRMDFLPEPGANAGLVLEGSEGRIRFVRYESSASTLSVIHEGHRLVSVPDFPGSPSIFLYLGVENGKVYARYSRDGKSLRSIPFSIPASALGNDLEVGAVYHKDPWMVEQRTDAPRFFTLLWTAKNTVPFRSGSPSPSN